MTMKITDSFLKIYEKIRAKRVKKRSGETKQRVEQRNFLKVKILDLNV